MVWITKRIISIMGNSMRFQVCWNISYVCWIIYKDFRLSQMLHFEVKYFLMYILTIHSKPTVLRIPQLVIFVIFSIQYTGSFLHYANPEGVSCPQRSLQFDSQDHWEYLNSRGLWNMDGKQWDLQYHHEQVLICTFDIKPFSLNKNISVW